MSGGRVQGEGDADEGGGSPERGEEFGGRPEEEGGGGAKPPGEDWQAGDLPPRQPWQSEDSSLRAGEEQCWPSDAGSCIQLIVKDYWIMS